MAQFPSTPRARRRCSLRMVMLSVVTLLLMKFVVPRSTPARVWRGASHLGGSATFAFGMGDYAA